jgi:putative RNA 2'-phosphotransferase
MAVDFVQLSKVMSHALRHQPWIHELELDEQGWVDVESLLAALRIEQDIWRDVDQSDLARMMADADKQRFEIRGTRIRAMYGHSLPGKLMKLACEPPALLYHGTSPQAAAQIRELGLSPMGRQYVHLSADRETAISVGRRKARQPLILLIRATEAYGNGAAFYRGNEKVWLADEVSPQFIEMRQ